MRIKPYITIDLTQKGVQRIPVSGCNRIWLPKFVIRNGVIFSNPLDAQIGIQPNDTQGDFVPWAIADGFMNSMSGDIQVLYVIVLQKGVSPAQQLVLATGDGVAASHGSTDGLSPVVGVGATQSSGSGGGK